MNATIEKRESGLSRDESATEGKPRKPVAPVRKSWLRRMLGWLLWIPLLPLMPFYGVYRGLRWLIRGGARFVWDDFGSFILGVYASDPKSGEVLWLRGVSYPEIVHFHPMVWMAWILAFAQVAMGHQVELLALLYFATFILCLVTVFADLPFKSFVKGAAKVCVLVPLADFGLGQLAIWGDTILVRHGWYKMLAVFERGILRPAWDGLMGLDAMMSHGMFILWGIGWFLFLVKPVALAWLDGRFELDRKELIRRKFFESDTRDPIYFRGSKLILSDMFEVAYGFADLKISLAGSRVANLKNVFGLAFWGRRAFNDLVNSQTPGERMGRVVQEPSVLTDDEDIGGVLPAEDELGHHDSHDDGSDEPQGLMS